MKGVEWRKRWKGLGLGARVLSGVVDDLFRRLRDRFMIWLMLFQRQEKARRVIESVDKRKVSGAGLKPIQQNGRR